MPNRLRVDATPPVVKVRHIGPHVVEPGARLKVRYLLNEPARVYVFLNGKRVVLGRSTRLKWKVEWPVRGRPGKYRVTLAARDVAGNLSDASRAVTIVIPLRVLTPRVEVAAGKRFAVRLATDGRAYHWELAKRGAFASGRAAGSARAEQAGPLHARGQAGQGAAPDRRRGEEEMSAQAAQIAGAVASVGLAALIVARPREARVAGLGAWAIGCILLAFYLAPSSHQRVLAAAAVVGVFVAVGLALLFRRWPWALAFSRSRASRRASPFVSAAPRRTCSCRCTRSSQAPRCCSPGSSCAAPSARASSDRSRGPRRLRRVDGVSLLWSGDPHQGAIAGVLLLSAVRPAGGVARAAALESGAVVGCCGELVAMAIAFAGDRDLPVDDAGHVLEPEGDRRQRVRAVLPRQLGLLRPVGVRAISRRRDHGVPRRRALLGTRADRRGAGLAISAVSGRG